MDDDFIHDICADLKNAGYAKSAQELQEFIDDLRSKMDERKDSVLGEPRVVPQAHAPSGLKASDEQVGGKHYKGFAIQPGIYSEQNGLSFFEGDVVKRVTRHRTETGKGVEDLQKAIHEIRLIAEVQYGVQL